MKFISLRALLVKIAEWFCITTAQSIRRNDGDVRRGHTMNNDRSDFRLRTLQRAHIYVLRTPGCGIRDTFHRRHSGHAETSARIINSRPLWGTGGHVAHGRERALRGSYTGAGTKQDVNLARKTLFSLGKVVNGRLGSRSR